MSRPKKFDCVEMKREIQRKLMEEFKHVPRDQAREVLRRRIEQDAEFAEFLKRVERRPAKGSRAE